MRRGVLFLFLTVFLDMLALGLVVPVLPQLVRLLTHSNGAHVASILGLFGTLFALMQFLFSPVLGSLSDCFGRRPVILLSNFGLAMDYLFMAMAPSVAWLACGRILSGITSASMAAANAYIADSADSKERAKEFGFIGAACALGFIVGPGIGGLLGKIDPRLPFWVAAVLSTVNGVCVLILLPESLPLHLRRNISLKQMNPFASSRVLYARPQLLRLGLIAFLNSLAGVLLSSVYVLYVGDRYRWDARSAGLSLMLAGTSSVLALATLAKPAIASLGEKGTTVFALACGAIGMAVFGCAESGSVFLLGIPLLALWGIAPASAQSIMSRMVEASEQGQLQGALASVTAMAALSGPIAFTWIYSRSCLAIHSCQNAVAGTMPGGVWLCSTLILLSASWLMLGVIETPTASVPSDELSSVSSLG